MNSLISIGLLLVLLQYHCICVDECTTETCTESEEKYSDLFHPSKPHDNIPLDRLQMKSLLRNYFNVTFDKLSKQQQQSLRKDGYIIIENVLSKHEVKELKIVYDSIVHSEGTSVGYEAHTENGAIRLGDLVNKGNGIFDKLWMHPILMECIYEILGAFKLSSLNGRHPLKGYGLQSLHSDTQYLNIFEWESPDINTWVVANSIWLLDDFESDNGATRIVPKSHLLGKHPSKILKNAKAIHEDEIIIQAKAGSIVIFNAHLWHGGTNNISGKNRRTIHSYFVKRNDYSQQTDQCYFLTQTTSRRLSYAQHLLLDCVPL